MQPAGTRGRVGQTFRFQSSFTYFRNVRRRSRRGRCGSVPFLPNGCLCFQDPCRFVNADPSSFGIHGLNRRSSLQRGLLGCCSLPLPHDYADRPKEWDHSATPEPDSSDEPPEHDGSPLLLHDHGTSATTPAARMRENSAQVFRLFKGVEIRRLVNCCLRRTGGLFRECAAVRAKQIACSGRPIPVDSRFSGDRGHRAQSRKPAYAELSSPTRLAHDAPRLVRRQELQIGALTKREPIWMDSGRRMS